MDDEFCKEALSSFELDDARRAEVLSNLRTGHADRFFEEGTTKNLDTAIDYGEQTLAAEGRGPDRHTELFPLGYLYRERFDVTHTRADAEVAIRYAEQAMALSGPEDPGWASVLALVADGHRQRFDCAGDSADLDVTIKRLEQAVVATASDDPQRARCCRTWARTTTHCSCSPSNGRRSRRALTGSRKPSRHRAGRQDPP